MEDQRLTRSGSVRISAGLIASLLGMLMLPLTHAAAQAPTAQAPVAQAPVDDQLEHLHTIGPPLTALRTKLADPRWLVAWLQRPSRLRRHPLMRRLRLTTQDAQAVARYLYTGSPPPDGSVQWQGGDAHTGELLFVSRGCRGCHAIEPAEESFSPRIPHLAGIGIKVRGDWLFQWLKSPRAYDPDTAMPQLGLSDDDARHLVAFLLSHREGADTVAAAPRFDSRAAPDLARQAIRRFDCAKCHLINGFRAIAPVTGWAITPKSCGNCHEPSGSSLAARPKAQADPNSAEAALRDGRRLIGYYHCGGCHRIEGGGGAIARHLERKTFAPPALDAEGARVQTAWLIDFLRQPTPLRVWLQMRMPNFGLSPDEAVALARYFAALAHAPPEDERPEEAAGASADLGLRRFVHFKCLQCHPAGAPAQLPEGVDVEDLSINLMLAKTRLRPSWLRDFLAHPKAIAGMETRMPAVFYTIDGVPKVEHPDEDIAAITAYLFHMSAPPTDSSVTTESNGEHHPIDWTTHPY